MITVSVFLPLLLAFCQVEPQGFLDSLDLGDFQGAVPTVPPPCEDNLVLKENCVQWAMKPHYFCERSSDYHQFMIEFCRLSCGLCIPNADDAESELTPEVAVLPPEALAQMTEEPVPEILPMYKDPCEGIYCDPIACMEDEIWSNDENSCCGTCVKTPKTGCKPVYKGVLLDNLEIEGATCKTLKPLVSSSCFGVCASSSLLLDGTFHKRCACCEAYELRKHRVPVECIAKGSSSYPLPLVFTTEYEYEIIDQCQCAWNSCGEPAIAKPDSKVMENYYDMTQIVNNFNTKDPRPEFVPEFV